MAMTPIRFYAVEKQLKGENPHGGIQERDSKNGCDAFST